MEENQNHGSTTGPIRAAGPPPFDTFSGSEFYQVAKEVYTCTNLNEEEYIQVGSFWDCNPFVLHSRGHVLYSTKKISPGGHWLGITGMAANKPNLDPMETIHAHTWVAIDL